MEITEVHTKEISFIHEVNSEQYTREILIDLTSRGTPFYVDLNGFNTSDCSRSELLGVQNLIKKALQIYDKEAKK